MSAPAEPRTSSDGVRERPSFRVRLLRARPADSRRVRRVYAGSLAFHALVVSSLALVPVTRAFVGREGREARIQVAWTEPSEPVELELEQEPDRPLEPEERDETPELVEQELLPEPPEPAPDEPVPTPLDDRPRFVDPLRDIAFGRFIAPRAPEPPSAVAPSAIVTPPPQPAARPPAEPVVLEDPEPDYPRAARRLGQSGSVTLRAQVGRDGRVIEVVIVSSSGHARLDEAALTAFREWRFRPWQSGEPDARSFRKTFTFKLP